MGSNGFRKSIEKMRIAAVDIGTNSFILLIVDLIDSKINVLHQEFAIPRLGEGIAQIEVINQAALERALIVLLKFKNIIQEFSVNKVIPIATAVLREVKNAEAVRTELSSALGYEIRIISGEDEAYYSFLGVNSYSKHHIEKCSVIDIGGGSTEIISGNLNGITYKASLPIGAAKIKDIYFRDDHYTKENTELTFDYVNLHFRDYVKIEKENIKGVGGTITTLAFIQSGLDNFDPDVIDNMHLSLIQLRSMLEELVELTPQLLSEKFKIHPKRADILLPGLIILITIMEKFGIKTINISSRGLRFGIIMDYLISPK